MIMFEGGLTTALLLTGLIAGVCCVDSTVVTQTAVAGLSTNINIPCALGREEEAPFWYINDTTYELFSILPLDFRYIPVVNGYTQLTIPVVVEELSGTLFRCAIYEPSGLVLDSIITQLIVQPNINPNDTETMQIPERNSLLLDYSNLDIEANSAAISWIFNTTTVCNRIFVLQGFPLTDVESGVLGTPTFSQMFQNASTGVIPSDQLTDLQGDPIVYRLLAVDENGDVCSMAITQVRFFRFDASETRQTRVLAPNSTTCYNIPVTEFCRAPLFVWPRSESNVSCACQVPNSFAAQAQEAFNSCSCLPQTDVRPFLQPDGTVCLTDQSAILNGTVVSFRCVQDRCAGERDCFVHTIISLHKIVIAGPPSPPAVTFDPNNGSLCFSAYSHPEFPLQSYDVQVTDNTSVTSSLSATYSTNGTLCLTVTFDPSPNICFPFRVSVTASSDAGTSSLSGLTFESSEGESSDSCSCYQEREQTSVDISDVTTTSATFSLTCGPDQTDSIDYTLQDNVQDQIVMLFCGQESQPVTGLLPNTSYVLYRRYNNTQLCTVGEFTTEQASTNPPPIITSGPATPMITTPGPTVSPDSSIVIIAVAAVVAVLAVLLVVVIIVVIVTHLRHRKHNKTEFWTNSTVQRSIDLSDTKPDEDL